jgi:hypothetical protein
VVNGNSLTNGKSLQWKITILKFGKSTNGPWPWLPDSSQMINFYWVKPMQRVPGLATKSQFAFSGSHNPFRILDLPNFKMLIF